VELKKGIVKSVDDEILRVVRTMPAWSPAKANDIRVRYQYALPVRIRQFDYLKFDSLVDYLDSNYNRVDQAMSSHYSVIKKGKSSFLVSYYLKNGLLVEEQMCKTIHPNVKHGENIIYFENKKVKTKGIFVNDKKAGIFKTYNQDGVLIKEENFENGIFKDLITENEGKDELIFTVCEQVPMFPGGVDAMKKFFKDNLVYPERAKMKGNEGVVYIEFVVERDGSISKPMIKRDIGYDCGEEALRLVKSMPKWEPGLQRGKAVRVQFVLPIKFSLN
jgi:protein TonB